MPARRPSSGRAPETRLQGKTVKKAATRTPAKKPQTPRSRKTVTKAKDAPTCFVISPFGSWYESYHRDIYCPAIEAANLLPQRADDLFRASNIVNDIWECIYPC